jgi:hypothetical protein
MSLSLGTAPSEARAVRREQSPQYDTEVKRKRAQYDKERRKPQEPRERGKGAKKKHALGTLGTPECAYCGMNNQRRTTQEFLARNVSRRATCTCPRGRVTSAVAGGRPAPRC